MTCWTENSGQPFDKAQGGEPVEPQKEDSVCVKLRSPREIGTEGISPGEVAMLIT